MAIRRRNKFNNVKDTRDPGEDRSQLSLDMGSEEYEEYKRDLAENNPAKKDDEFHAQAEEHNVEIRETAAEAVAASASETIAELKFRKQQASRESLRRIRKNADRAVSNAESRAASTPSKMDDARARALRKQLRDQCCHSDFVPGTGINAVYDDGLTDKEHMDNSLPGVSDGFIPDIDV